jgi:ketosteroid isomerase-like protein
MSGANVDLVHTIYELGARNESPGRPSSADLEYVNPPYAVESGVRHGRDALARVRDVYPEFRVRAERFIDAAEDVVVPGEITGTSVSGVEVKTRQTYVWTVRDGRAVRFRWFTDLEEALAAVGLAAREVEDSTSGSPARRSTTSWERGLCRASGVLATKGFQTRPM